MVAEELTPSLLLLHHHIRVNQYPVINIVFLYKYSQFCTVKDWICFLPCFLSFLSGLIYVDVHVLVFMLEVAFVYIANFPHIYQKLPVPVSTQLWKDFSVKWNWRIGNGVPSEEWNLTERLISHKCQDLPPHHWTSTKNVSPSFSQWTYYWNSGWTAYSLHSLPIIQPAPDPQGTCM